MEHKTLKSSSSTTTKTTLIKSTENITETIKTVDIDPSNLKSNFSKLTFESLDQLMNSPSVTPEVRSSNVTETIKKQQTSSSSSPVVHTTFERTKSESKSKSNGKRKPSTEIRTSSERSSGTKFKLFDSLYSPYETSETQTTKITETKPSYGQPSTRSIGQPSYPSYNRPKPRSIFDSFKSYDKDKADSSPLDPSYGPTFAQTRLTQSTRSPSNKKVDLGSNKPPFRPFEYPFQTSQTQSSQTQSQSHGPVETQDKPAGLRSFAYSLRPQQDRTKPAGYTTPMTTGLTSGSANRLTTGSTVGLTYTRPTYTKPSSTGLTSTYSPSSRLTPTKYYEPQTKLAQTTGLSSSPNTSSGSPNRFSGSPTRLSASQKYYESPTRLGERLTSTPTRLTESPLRTRESPTRFTARLTETPTPSHGYTSTSGLGSTVSNLSSTRYSPTRFTPTNQLPTTKLVHEPIITKSSARVKPSESFKKSGEMLLKPGDFVAKRTDKLNDMQKNGKITDGKITGVLKFQPEKVYYHSLGSSPTPTPPTTRTPTPSPRQPPSRLSQKDVSSAKSHDLTVIDMNENDHDECGSRKKFDVQSSNGTMKSTKSSHRNDDKLIIKYANKEKVSGVNVVKYLLISFLIVLIIGSMVLVGVSVYEIINTSNQMLTIQNHLGITELTIRHKDVLEEQSKSKTHRQIS